MAFMINADCISCGVCEEACPNHVISKHEKRSIYVIDSDSCTECVGFFHLPQCAVVCPMNCCLPDPRNVKSEAVLFELAQSIHPDKVLTLTVETSHYQKPIAEKWWKRLFGSEPTGNAVSCPQPAKE